MASIKSLTVRGINRILRFAGAELNPLGTRKAAESYPGFPDVEHWVAEILEEVRPFTMTSGERVSALCHAVRYISRCNIPGDIVECGVWRGGSMMAVAKTLLLEQDRSRTLYLFDTFEGMTPPTEVDRDYWGRYASSRYNQTLRQDSTSSFFEEPEKSSLTPSTWAYAPFDEVRANMESTNYPTNRTRFIRGKVEETIPKEAPDKIAILRLDTDWFESTKHELIHLYPRLSVGGILIIDDYGHWEGARKAVDGYISDNRCQILLNRIDYTGRIAVKSDLVDGR